MKKILILSILFVSFFAVKSSAQCGDDLLKQALKEMGDTQYMKDFTVDLQQEKKRY